MSYLPLKLDSSLSTAADGTLSVVGQTVSALSAATGLNLTDLVALVQGSSDVKATLAQVTTFAAQNVATWTTATRPTIAAGQYALGFNSTLGRFDFWNGTAWVQHARLSGDTFAGAVGSAVVALTDAASIATDASKGNVFTVALGGNRTLANPTNLVAGFFYTFQISQDATGSRTLAFGSLFSWKGGTAPTLSTAANAVDVISGYYDGVKLRMSFGGSFA